MGNYIVDKYDKNSDFVHPAKRHFEEGVRFLLKNGGTNFNDITKFAQKYKDYVREEIINKTHHDDYIGCHPRLCHIDDCWNIIRSIFNPADYYHFKNAPAYCLERWEKYIWSNPWYNELLLKYNPKLYMKVGLLSKPWYEQDLQEI